MFKKLALVAVALAIAVPVFADNDNNDPPKQESGITISNEDAFVLNEVSAVGISGKNNLFSLSMDGYSNDNHDNHDENPTTPVISLTTGNLTVGADVYTDLNHFQSVNCACSKVDLTNDNLEVINKVSAVGISGKNEMGSGTLTTGTVWAYPTVKTLGNVTVFGDI